jgi:predicted MPP superfamily phosphohydrolase
MMTNVLNGFVLLALVAGHTELWVAAINRLHSFRLSSKFLQWSRRLHDVAVPIFPLVLVWRVGLTDGGVLRGGRWSDLPLGWQVVSAFCVAGVVGLVIATGRWQWRRRQPIDPDDSCERIDVARDLGHRPIGSGPYQLLAKLPLNEAFHVEISHKTLRVPTLPQALDGFRILHLSDVHFLGTVDRSYFETVFDRLAQIPVDLIAFTGDLFDNLACRDWLATTFARLDAPHGKLFILGNHDWYLDPAAIRGDLTALGWTDVSGSSRVLGMRGEAVIVAGSEYPWLGERPELPPSNDDSSESFRLLLSHTPDDLPWARRHGINLMLAGHNHGGQVILPVIGPVYSPSRFGVWYAGGTFLEPPTVLHVSRGLSGRHPLRWNCLPEVTVLTLRK